ncbi:dihydrodipicolinate reductase, partial [Tanacetum coccineum]
VVTFLAAMDIMSKQFLAGFYGYTLELGLYGQKQQYRTPGFEICSLLES